MSAVLLNPIAAVPPAIVETSSLKAIVQERCGEDATLLVDLRAVSIEEPAKFGEAPVLVRTILTHGPDHLRFLVAMRAMDEELFSPFRQGIYPTRLSEDTSPVDQVLALTMIHNEAHDHLNDPDMFDRAMKLMSLISQPVIDKMKE